LIAARHSPSNTPYAQFNAKSVVRHIMKIGDEETRMLIKDSVLPDSLTQIIDAIAGDKIEKP